MTATQFETRTDQPVNGALIASRADDGYRVYSIDNPKERYLVQWDEERWTCTCPDFETHQADTAWRCAHILTVAPWPKGEPAQVPQPDNRTANATVSSEPPEEPPSEKKRGRKRPNGSAQMLIKRSVSPDGRIDSVSVEFSMPVSDLTTGEVKDKALTALQLQREIVSAFLKLNGNGSVAAQPSPRPNGSAPHAESGNGGPVVARMLDIGRVPGRWGDRLCITFDINGRRSKLFGSAKQLAAHIGAAGSNIQADQIAEGLRLNIACRVATRPSDDGKYLNIEQVFPVGKEAGNGGANGNRYH